MSTGRKKMRRRMILVAFELILLILLAIVLFIVIKISKIQREEMNMDNVSVNDGIPEESQEIMSGYRTVALFGLDNRSTGKLSKGRSDVIMIASINDSTHEVKLASVYRDSFLDTGDGVYEKCNAAYAKGGPEQAISMLNTNLDLAITDYVTVDFSALVECVDLLGGVELTITDDEAILMLGYIQEINKITGNKSECPDSGGTYTLDGVQACAYARIRYGGGDDYRRTERQRAVLAAMVQKAQRSDLKTINSLIDQVFGDIQTSFTNAELLSLAANMFHYSMGETSGFPYEKAAKRYDREGDVVIPCDLASNVTQLHAFLYDDTTYVPSETVQKNSETIISKTGLRQGDGF